MSAALEQNVPNPYSDRTEISYVIAEKGMVRLVVTDVLGNEIAVLVNETMKPGRYTVPFTTEQLLSGIYYYRLETNGQIITQKMTVVK